MRNLLRVVLAVPIALALAVTAGGCGSSAATSSATSQQSGGRTEAQTIVNHAKGLPAFSFAGTPYNARKAIAGKTIFSIPSISGIPYHDVADPEMKRVALALGAKNFIIFPNQGSPKEWASGIELAIARHVDIIQLGDLDPTLVIPQLEDAKKAGIPVVLTAAYPEETPLPASVKNLIVAQRTAPFKAAARIVAAWFAANVDKPNVLISTSNEQPPNPPIVNAFTTELQRLSPGASTVVSNVALTDWATKIPGETESALIRNPTINAAYPVYDAQSQYVETGLRQANKLGQIPIASYNGSADVLKQIQDGSDVKADVGENLLWLAWANLDTTIRALDHQTNIPADQKTALRLFDKSNVDAAGRPPKDGQGYGDAYIKGYEKLWQTQVPPA